MQTNHPSLFEQALAIAVKEGKVESLKDTAPFQSGIVGENYLLFSKQRKLLISIPLKKLKRDTRNLSNTKQSHIKRINFADLLSYLIAGIAGFYLNSVPIMGLFLSPFILFILKISFKKLFFNLPNNGHVEALFIWFFLGIPASFLTSSIEGKFHIVTPLTKKYSIIKKDFGTFADHFPEEINLSKDIAEIRTYRYRGGLLQMPAHFAVEIQYLDNFYFQKELVRLESKSEPPPKGPCGSRIGLTNEFYSLKERPWLTTTYWLSKISSEKRNDYSGYKFLFFSNNGEFYCDNKTIKNTMKAAAIDRNKKTIRYFARPF